MNLLYKYCIAFVLFAGSIHAYGQAPNANFTNSNPEGCAPLNVTFTSAEQGSGFTHTWDFGNGVITSAPKNPSRNYTAPGTYTVKHTITDANGKSSTETKTNLVIIHPTPTVAFSGTNVSGCPPLTVNFSNQSTTTVPGGLTYNWVLGAGATPATSNAANPTATYNNPGTHNVTLQVTNSKGCMASKQVPLVTVLDVPTVDFSATTTDFCPGGGTTTFTPTVTGQAPSPFTYSWNLGNGTSAAQNPTQTYTGSGPTAFTVTLTVTSANTCTKTITKTNYIKIHNVTSSFTAPASACVGEAVNFNNTSTAGSTSLWNFGDGPGNSTLKSPTYIYQTAGTYTVTLVSGMGPCTHSSTRTILIRPRPTPQINLNPSGLCPAPQTITFSTTPAMSTYNWTFQNTTGQQTSTSATPSQTYTQNGFFAYELTMTDGFGCKNTIQGAADIIPLDITTKVNNKPETDSGCVSFKAEFSVSLWRDPLVYKVPYPKPIKKAFWRFGDGNSTTLTTPPFAPTYTYTDSGVFTVIVDIETVNGCTISDTMIVKAGYKPILTDFKATPLVLCPKNWVDFVATAKGYSPLVYKWDFGDGGSSTKTDDSTAKNFYRSPGIFDIKLIVYHRGCPDSLEKKKYIEVLPPKAEFDFKQDCANMLRVSFKDTSLGDSSRYWNFGDGNTSTVEYPVHVYATAGVYNVMLAVYNSKANCHDTIIKPVVVGRNQPVMQANKTKLCKGDSVTFSATEGFVTTSAVGFYWYVNDVQVGFTAKNGPATYTHIFTTPGQYTIKVVSLTVDNQCKDSTVKTNYITVGGPLPGFMSDYTKICEPGIVNFTDTSKTGAGTNITQRFWDFGTTPPSTSSSTNPSNTYWVRGAYDIKLVLTDNIGCKDSIIKPKFINVQKPDAIFTPKNPACAGVELTMNNQSQSAQNYEWDFGDGNSSTETNPKHIYAAKGPYNARLIAIDDLGCRDTSVIVIDAIRPTANFTMTDSMSICPPLITGFDGSASVNAKSYWWDFDDGASPGTKKVHTVAYNNKKEYKVRLVVTDTAGCTDTLMRTAQVLGYEGAFSSDIKEGCVPLTVTFTSTVKGFVPSLTWDFGDGNAMQGSSTQPTVTYTYTKAGIFIPSLIFNNNKGCSVGSDGDTILVDDVTPEFETGPACQYSIVKFTNKSTSFASGVNSTLWTFHDGSTDTDPNTDFKYGAPGQYRVKLLATNTRGCIDSIEKDITINVPFEVNAGADSVICLTDSVQLFPTGGVSYVWSPPGALSCLSCTNPFAYPKVKTKYTVISTDINGCHDTDAVEIGIKTHVTSIVGNGGEICEGEKFVLNVSGANTYLWTPADDLDNATSSSPVATPKNDTRYRVVAYEGKCIPDTSHVNVTVHPKPTVNARGEQTIVAGTSADLIASGNHIVRFLWTPSGTLSCEECADPVASPFKTTKYTVKVYTRYDCVDSADVTITVLCDKSQVYIPNTFTPNGDGMNDIFMVRGNGLTNIKSFRVYNRWGEVVFERTNVTANDKANGWDGSHNGAQLPPDVYVYTTEVYCENGDLLQLKGDVTIIR